MTHPQPPIAVIGSVVILSGRGLDTAFVAASVAQRTRKRNGMCDSAAINTLLAACTSARGQADVPEMPEVTESIDERPTVTVEEAATMLGLSPRQTRRIAEKLGGQIIGGRWLLDMQAIIEYTFTPSDHPVTVPAFGSPLPYTDRA